MNKIDKEQIKEILLQYQLNMWTKEMLDAWQYDIRYVMEIGQLIYDLLQLETYEQVANKYWNTVTWNEENSGDAVQELLEVLIGERV